MGHRGVGVLDVDVVAGPGHHGVTSAEPPDRGRRAPRRSSSRQVSSWSPVSDEHRALHACRISASSMALVELARDARRRTSGRPSTPSRPPPRRAPWRARCIAQSVGQPRVVAPAVRAPSPPATPTASRRTGGPDRCGRTSCRHGSRRCRRAAPARPWAGPSPSMFTIQRTISGHVAATPRPVPAEGVGDEPHRSPAQRSDQHGEVEVDQRPGEACVERPAVAVATEVDGHHVVSEVGDPGRDAVEHAAVVVPPPCRHSTSGSAGSPHPQVRSVVRPMSTSSARAGSAIPPGDHGRGQPADRSRFRLRSRQAEQPGRWRSARGTGRWPPARWTGRPRCRRRPAARACGCRRSARPSCRRSSPSRRGWWCWAGPRSP